MAQSLQSLGWVQLSTAVVPGGGGSEQIGRNDRRSLIAGFERTTLTSAQPLNRVHGWLEVLSMYDLAALNSFYLPVDLSVIQVSCTS